MVVLVKEVSLLMQKTLLVIYYIVTPVDWLTQRANVPQLLEVALMNRGHKNSQIMC